MHHDEILFRHCHFLGREHVAVLQAQIFVLGEKSFSLNARHIQDVKLADHVVKRGRLAVTNAFVDDVRELHIARNLQLLGRDKDKFDAAVTRECRDQ